VPIKLAHASFGSFISLEHARRVLSPQSAKVQKLVHEQKANGTVIDLTSGRRTTAVVPLDNGQLVLVSAQPKKLKAQGFDVDLADFLSPRPLLVVLTGPSGAGKDSLLARLKSRDRRIYIVVNVTTRPPRPGEQEGVDYHFVSKTEFDQLLREGELLEHALVYGQDKGVPRAPIREALASGQNVLLRTDIQGARTIKRLVPGATTIFVSPPSEDELRRRVRERGADTQAQVKLREETATKEMAAAEGFDYQIINDDLDETASEIGRIMSEERSRANRRKTVV
jgi:guanylate kinase